MTCNNCQHLTTSQKSPGNMPTRLVCHCGHPDACGLLVFVRRVFSECPATDKDVMCDLIYMADIVGDHDKKSWIRYKNIAKWRDAWSVLRDRIEKMEIKRPDWCPDMEEVF